MTAHQLAAAPRSSLLAQIAKLPTNELRGMLLARDAETGAERPPLTFDFGLRLPELPHGIVPPNPLADRRRPKAKRAPRPTQGSAPRVATPAALALETSTRILTAVGAGARSRTEILRVGGINRSQFERAAKSLREKGSLHMAGTRRFARYGLTATEAKAALKRARQEQPQRQAPKATGARAKRRAKRT